ncbi:hypothetical protein D3C84_805750 [compost metagenome]
MGGYLLLALLDDQVGLHFQIALAIALSWAQATLIKLASHRLADALFSQVALDARIVRTVLQRRFLPHPTAIGSKVATSIEIHGCIVALAGAEQHH